MIALQNLSVLRGARAVLQGIDLTAELGTVTVIIGPNGSGKSTLMGAIAGQLRYQGAIQIAGREVARCSAAELADLRAVMAQHSNVAFAFSVAEVVALGARGCLAPPQLAPTVSHMLQNVGLAGFDHRPAQSLSGGESQRMHLARALLQSHCAAQQPNWLLLDEPISSLDLQHQLAVIRLARAHAQAGGGVLAILHDLNFALMVADQIAVLDQGKLAAKGAPDRVITDDLIEQVFGCQVPLCKAPDTGKWMLVQAAE